MKNLLILKLMLFVSILLGFNEIKAQSENFSVNQVSYLDIDSAITPGTLEYLQTHLKNIPKSTLVIIRMNTPGGLVTTTKEIISAINEHPAPKVIWVAPSGASAASAGAIISAAADFIVMSPGSTIGAATPVGINEDIKESDAKNKILNDLVALIESLSTMRGRNPTPFKEMITEAKSFGADEAKKKGVSLGNAESTQDILDLLKGKTFKRKGVEYTLNFSSALDFVVHELTLYQKILSTLAQPQLAYILFLVGIALLYFELQAPGGYIAGGLGLISLLIAAISFQVLPLNWGALALIILGVVLFVLEIYITSYGLLSVGGVISLTLGSLFLFQAEHALILPPKAVILSTLFSILFVMGCLSYFFFKTRRTNQDSFFSPLGKEGVVLKKTPHHFQVKVEGQIWRATSEDDLTEHDKIVVTHYDDKKLELGISKMTRS
ncbi:MAG TPA: NfeD family protein [Bacteriovoracaceae bacterium]|nr:NfeD family protein [Bacteriovoracaceae bacterium]